MMESWEVLEQAIPRAKSQIVAHKLGVCADYVRKWRREPDSDESPTATGQRSILDRICDLIDAVFLINPAGAGLIVNHIHAHHDSLLRVHAKPIASRESQAEAGAGLLTEAAEAVNALNVDGLTDHTYRQLVELRDRADLIIKQFEKTTKEGSDA